MQQAANVTTHHSRSAAHYTQPVNQAHKANVNTLHSTFILSFIYSLHTTSQSKCAYNAYLVKQAYKTNDNTLHSSIILSFILTSYYITVGA